MNILREVILDSSIRKKDGSVKLSFVTSLEQNTKEFCEIDEQRNQHGLLYFKPSGEFTQEELTELNKVKLITNGNKDKSKSQQLREELLKLHRKTYKNENNNYIDFENFYSDTMGKIIEHYKNKLDEK